MPVAKKILLDTNFLMIPASLGVDIFEKIEEMCDFPYELFVLEKSKQELERIQGRGRGKDSREAKLALSLIDAKKINVLIEDSNDYVDDVLVSLNDEYIIATQDTELKKRLTGRKIFLRQKKYLVQE
jgi:rRNA-processing protein FCF1